MAKLERGECGGGLDGKLRVERMTQVADGAPQPTRNSVYSRAHGPATNSKLSASVGTANSARGGAAVEPFVRSALAVPVNSDGIQVGKRAHGRMTSFEAGPQAVSIVLSISISIKQRDNLLSIAKVSIVSSGFP